MSVYKEEDVASDVVAPDFSELLDLPEIALSGAEDVDVPITATVANEPMPPLSPSQLEDVEYGP